RAPLGATSLTTETTRVHSDNPYRIGRQVQHPTFGMGTIQACDGNAEDRKVTIRFQNGDSKKLLVRLCNLQLM
ncbi:MAG: hypothetical protein JNK65_03795, partial [Deltaproteobacteria bacterium]|nr:hypothetical protein [Deltaproteobacteria bacterium]